MCGLTGALALNHRKINAHDAKPMVDILAHRGPDDAGYLFYHTGCRHPRKISFALNLADDNFRHIAELLPGIASRAALHELNSHDWDLFLGHRRLSILDVSAAGHQPMSDLSKNIWVVYNGEIYNFKDLRQELRTLGHRFRTETDTEVIVYAYIEWGMDCVRKFNGMFSLALYDNFTQTLYSARDRYGMKPLYMTVVAEEGGAKTLLFASEVKSLLQYQDCRPDLDHEALLEYFTFQNLFSDRTLFRGIRLLPAGSFLRIHLPSTQDLPPDFSFAEWDLTAPISAGNEPVLSWQRYWDYDFREPDTVLDEETCLEELHRLFARAVQRQLVSDVEVGCYLSGGMDSAAVTCLASRGVPNLKSFTVGFDLHSASGLELGFDERPTAEHLSYLYRTEHYEMVLKSGDMERCLPAFAWHLEEPRVGQSYPNYYAAKLAGHFVKVCLSGTGGDELFAGYPWRYYRAAANADFETYIDTYYQFWQRLLPNAQLKNLFAPIRDKIDHVWTRDIFRNVFQDKHQAPGCPEDGVNRSLYFEAKTFLHGLLVVEDKLSMAHGLETRAPFLDNDLVDFAMRLPMRYKLSNLGPVARLDENAIGPKRTKYFQKNSDGKQLLRRMMRQYVPESITKAVKQGFCSPDKSWFRGDSIEFVRKQILDTDSPIYAYFDGQTIREMVGEHLEGRKNRRLFIWSLINFDAWLRCFKIR